jgi:hypothetical protein
MKSTALLACEKLIVDKDGAHSLINVMHSAAVVLQPQKLGDVPQRIPIPSDAVVPNQWWIYSVWMPSLQDVGGSFEQVYQLYWPSGEKFAENRLAFTQKDHRLQQTSFYYVGFPVGQPGNLRIVSWLDREGQRVSDIIETYVRIDHSSPESPIEGAPTTP